MKTTHLPRVLAVIFTSIFLSGRQIYGSKSVHYKTMQLIRDLADYTKKILPTPMVTAFLCWPEAEAIQFSRFMSSNGILSTTHVGCQKFPPVETIPTQPYSLNVLDAECGCFFKVLEQASNRNLFKHRTRWLVTDGGGRTTRRDDDLGQLLESLDVHVASELWLSRAAAGGGFQLLEVYRTAPGRRAVWLEAGEWRPATGLRAAADPVTASRRANLRGATIAAATAVTNNQTLVHMTDMQSKHIDSITRMNYVLLETAIQTMNATLKLIIRPTWGYKVNGSWTGVVGEVVRGNALVAAAGMLLYRERQEVMDYAVMTTPTKLGFVFRQPPLSSVSNVFTLPFSGAVWLSVAAMVALCSAVLYAALAWEARHLRTDQPPVSWSDVLLLSLGAVCQQGSPLESRGTSGRTASLLLFVAVIFLYTSYSAYIVALLQSTTNSIRTLRDLLHSRLDLAVEDIVYNRYYFEAEREPLRRELYRKKIAPPGKPSRFIALEDGIERVRKGFFAFHFETGKGFKVVQETFTEEEKCGLRVISFIQVVDAYMALQKDTPYREIIVIAYRKLMERGFQKRAWDRYYTKKPDCIARGSSFVYVGLIDCYPAMLVLIFGALCSLAMLLVELIVHKRCKKTKGES